MEKNMADIDTDVMIVGTGPAGAATAALLASSGINTFVTTLPTANQPAWEAVLYSTFYQQLQHIVVPTGGTTAAFWVIDAKTGAATAMLLDGSGGARSDAGGCSSADFGVLLNNSTQ